MPDATRVLLIENDLFFTAKILSALDKMGCSSTTVSRRDEIEPKLSEGRTDLVIINLASPVLGSIETIELVKSLPDAPKVLAYLSHTKIPGVRDQVLDAGADKLCANSAISMRLPALVRDVLAGTGPREEE